MAYMIDHIAKAIISFKIFFLYSVFIDIVLSLSKNKVPDIMTKIGTHHLKIDPYIILVYHDVVSRHGLSIWMEWTQTTAIVAMALR